MKIKNSIGWCDETTNAVTGCDKVSAGCKNCYAQVGTRARVLRAQGIETWGPNGVRHPVAGLAATVRRLNKLCVCGRCGAAAPFEKIGMYCGCEYPYQKLRRIRLFADSNSDWLDTKWPIETLALFLETIRRAPNVDVILLTKRLENFESRISQVIQENIIGPEFDDWLIAWLEGHCAPAHLWFGVSVENQAMADLRIGQLLEIPAAVRLLSVEPLLEHVDLDIAERNHNGELHWVIVGGESGKHRRDCGVEAIVSVAEQCRAAGVPVYVKQDCAFKSGEQGRIWDDVWKLKQFPNHQLAGSGDRRST